MRLFKKILYLVVFLYAFCCCKGNDISTKSVHLVREEFLSPLYGKPSAPQQVGSYYAYAYNSAGHLTEIKDYRQNGSGALVLVYDTQLQYSPENKISQITISNGITTSCKWTGKSVETTIIFADKRSETAIIDLNTSGLPIKKTRSTVVQEILYDSKENVIKTIDNSTTLSTQYTDYDVTRLNPRSSNYELRIFNNLTINEGFIGVSKNWFLKYKDTSNTTRNNDHIIKETNSQGYPTLVEETDGITTYSIKYTYSAD